MSGVVFLGPSLPRAEAEARLNARYRPPARCGDIYRAVRDDRPAAILLVDGRFHDTPSVWHREILWAMQAGVAVFGAASMGALRAAELAPFGMVGVGRIAAAYRDGRWPGYADAFDDDGEVAIAHGPEALGSAPLTVALVDIRHRLAEAHAAGLIDAAARDAALGAVAAIHYADRTPERAANALAAHLGNDALATRLASASDGIKAADARAGLDALARHLAAGSPAPAPSFRLEEALVWARFRAAMDLAPAPVTPEEAAALDALRGDPAAWQAVRRQAAHRLAATRTAPDVDASQHAAARRAALRDLQRSHGLADRAALEDWMRRNALTPAALEDLLDVEARLARPTGDAPESLTRAMLDVLRLEDRFAGLARSGGGGAAPETLGAARRTALLARFLDRHRDIAPRDASVPGLVRLLDCRDEAHLFAVLERAMATVPESSP